MNKGLPYLVGQPVDVAMSALGEPARSTEKSDYTLYEWEAQYNGNVPITQGMTSQTSGGLSGGRTYGATAYMPLNYQCLIKLTVDDEGVVQGWEFSGNHSGCKFYEKGVKRLIP
tara:strand:+ start:88781 stop:89122 length:342 start_codon:yes stop_codon:yes gene_type:complete